MTSENSKDECLSQGDKSDEELDLMSIVQDDLKDVILVAENSTPPSNPSVDKSPPQKVDSQEDCKSEELLCELPSNQVKSIVTGTVEIFKARPIPPPTDSKLSAKPSKSYQNRKTNNRHRSNKRTSFRSNQRTSNIDNVDKWKHDKFEMFYGDSNSNATANVEMFTTNDNSIESNVEEIKDCIVSKLQSLTLPKSSADKKSLQNHKMENINNHHTPRKGHAKPALSVVVTDNTKKVGERKSPAGSPLSQPSRVESPKVPNGVSASNGDNNTPATSATYKLLPLQSPSAQTSSAHHSGKSTHNANKEFKPATTTKDKSITTPYHPRSNKKYFDSQKNETKISRNYSNNPSSSYSEYTDYNLPDVSTNYPDQSYFMDQGYYYYPPNPSYYPATTVDMLNVPYQPNVYFQQGFTPNVYYNDSGIQPQYTYYNNQQMYNEGVYYQPAPQMDAYFSPDQQYYNNYRGNSYRWGGRSNYHQNRFSRRH